MRVPRRFIELAKTVICHRDAERFAVLYALLWRIARGEQKLLAIVSDPLVRRAEALAHSVRLLVKAALGVEIEACRPWLVAEIDLVHPEMSCLHWHRSCST